MLRSMATDIGDLVLVYVNNSPAFFARIEGIEPDVKPEWWQVRLLILQTPLKTVSWIIREPYIQGEVFTMGGTPIRLEKVIAPVENEPGQEDLLDRELPPASREEQAEADKGRARVISLTDRLKKQPPDQP